MAEFYSWLFGAATFMPHGYCLLWRPDLVALHAVSDTAIAASYFIIPAAIFAFLRKRADLTREHRRIAALFIAFIVACGLTHVAGLVTLWAPLYGLEGLVKLGTAAVSASTAFLVWPLIPKLLAVPSPRELAHANQRLMEEIEAKNTALVELEQVRQELEAQVAARTHDLQVKAADAQRAADALRVTTERFERALRGSDVTMFEQDSDLRYTWIANPPEPLAQTDFIGRTDDDTLPAAAVPLLTAQKRGVIATGNHVRTLVTLPYDQGARTYHLDIAPIVRAGQVTGVRAVAVDVTAEKAAQERLEIVLKEMAHRTKNLFAVIISLVSQVSRATAIPQAAADALTERLQSLARAQDLMIAGSFGAVPLHDVIRRQLAPLDAGRRVILDGEDGITIPPEAAQMLALAMHELATNALKHGAWTAPEGGVRVSWRREAGAVRLEWREEGGPLVSPPTRAGFGRALLERLVPRALGGEAEVDYAAGGVRYALRFPL